MISKIIILSLIILSHFASLSLQAQDVEERRAQILNLLDEEIKEVSRLNKQIRSGDPKLLVRLADLYLEKARLIKEKENKEYLTMSPDERNHTNKKEYFRESNNYFLQAQKVCVYTLKRFKNFEDKATVLYIIAQNSKEYQDFDKAKKYFKYALKASRPGSEINRKAILATAEGYYNDKVYSQAIRLYEQVIRNKADRWWTKDAYNLAWCYYRVRKYNQAVSLLKQVVETSEDSKYINMKPESERDLALFYAEMGKSDLAVAYYQKKGGDNVTNLIKVGKYLSSQGKQASAEKVFDEALKYDMDPKQAIEIHVMLLPMYEKFGKDAKHIKSCEYLTEQFSNLSDGQKEVLDFQIKTYGAKLQKQVADKTYQNAKKTLNLKTENAVRYFNMSAKINPKEAYRYYFLSAETYYAAGMYKDALDEYNKAQEASEKNGETKFRSKAVEGAISSVDKSNLSKDEKFKYLTVAYMSFIKTSDNPAKIKKVSQRLFNIYHGKGDMENCERVLTFYNKKFENDHGTTEVMLARVMEYYKSKKDKHNLIRMVNKIKSGEFQVSDKYAKTLTVYLLTMQFENVESSASKGDKVNALKGYLLIFKDSDSSKEAKKNAAYNITTLVYELGNLEKTYEWCLRSIALMPAKDVEKFSKTLMLITLDFFYRGAFNKSLELNDKIADKLCEHKSDQAVGFLKNNLILNLAVNQDRKAKNIIQLAKSCGVKEEVLNDMKLEVAKFYNEEKSWTELNQYLDEIDNSKEIWPSLIPYYFSLQNAYSRNAHSALAAKIGPKIMNLYSSARAIRLKFPLESLDIVANYKIKELYESLVDFYKIKLEFPEKRFNELLKLKFKKLEGITSKSLDLLSLGSGLGLVRTYKYLVDTYQYLIDEITNFTPAGKSPEYVDSFKKGISSVLLPLQKKVADYRIEANKQIQNEKILSRDNSFFTQNSNIPVAIDYQYPKGALIMDKGGK